MISIYRATIQTCTCARCTYVTMVTTAHHRLLFTATHEQNFSQLKYDTWLKNRKVRGSGVAFSEIDVLLCNKPTPDEIIATLPTLPRESKLLSLVQLLFFQINRVGYFLLFSSIRVIAIDQ